MPIRTEDITRKSKHVSKQVDNILSLYTICHKSNKMCICVLVRPQIECSIQGDLEWTFFQMCFFFQILSFWGVAYLWVGLIYQCLWYAIKAVQEIQAHVHCLLAFARQTTSVAILIPLLIHTFYLVKNNIQLNFFCSL